MRRASDATTNCSNQAKLPGNPNIAEEICHGNGCRENRQHHVQGIRCPNTPLTFSIDITKPTRLPPWEIFQRGPSEQQAQPSNHGPHRKILTKVTDAAGFANVSFQIVQQWL